MNKAGGICPSLVHGICESPSSDPESHPKVGFESVSGFGFRVSIGPGDGKSSESVSGFGFRVSIGPGEGKSSESLSGFGFRSVLGKVSLQSRFRVSGFDRSWGR